jgi:hypothetical protein
MIHEMKISGVRWKEAWEPFVTEGDMPLMERLKSICREKGVTMDQAHKVRLLELEELLFAWTFTLSPGDEDPVLAPISYLWEPLFYANVNDPVLYRRMEDSMREYLDDWPNILTQYNKTLQALEWAEQIPALGVKGIFAGPGLKERMIHFLLNREIALRYELEPGGGRMKQSRKVPVEEKMIINTNSTTLILLFKVLIETKHIKHMTGPDLCRFLASNFGTEQAANLSVDSLRNKYKETLKADIDKLRVIFKEGDAHLSKLWLQRFE